ncbi:STAS domain-containing protein [Vibrio sp.]|uniref:STAS domain-containing protein n=1 Tax=Vibrio viridaestus TaxID=2487322 RepID=A0A3N9TC14_9VIBR|nr:STAS domain-containing protein [Vibrio viridaestus]MDC0611306.1 STAS domain-containing protein [Vibrio sp.]RQW61550.1 STAS domain-containing protein [Vibrio viridaestus]
MHSQWSQISSTDYELTGALDRDEVPQLWAALKQWQPKENTITISLAAVERVDSAGMAMLIHLIENAKNQNCHIMYSFVPEQLLTLFKLSNVGSLVSEHLDIKQG